MILLLASGTMPEEDVARAYGLTPAGLREKLRKNDLQLRVDGERARLTGAFTLAQIKLLNTLDQATDNIIRDVNDPTSKTNLDTSKWVVTKFVPDRTLNVVKQTTEIRGEVAESMAASLERLSSVMVQAPIDIEKSPHVMDGKDAVPTYGATPPPLPEPQPPATQKSVGTPGDDA